MAQLMQQQIASAFGDRRRPENLTDIVVCSSLRDDALQFEGKDWANVNVEDWLNYSDAFFGFTPDAFVYFLPSVLSLSLDRLNGGLSVAASLIMALDTSAEPDIWPEWFVQRFCRLTADELGVLKDWSAHYLAGTDKGEGSEFARVRDTLTMLELCLQG